MQIEFSLSLLEYHALFSGQETGRGCSIGHMSSIEPSLDAGRSIGCQEAVGLIQVGHFQRACQVRQL
jgi:hypothetical protein